MKKLRAGLLRSKSHEASRNAPPVADSPESNAAQGIRQFCESASAGNSGEEVLHLPVIVEAAESSPQAAAAAAYQIRKLLAKDQKSSVQYNAIMLIRILADNPGPSFTRNIDAKFVHTVRDLLKSGRDPSVQQMLRETLDSLEATKSHDNGLYDLLNMWRSIKGVNGRIAPQMSNNRGGPPMAFQPYPLQQQQQQQQQPQQQQQQPYGTRTLPTLQELASRIEEARNTAKILLQLVQSTPPAELLGNELIKEFAERSQSAQHNMQEYINCNSPAPDDDTMQTLIETNEQLSLAQSRHQRAILSARRTLGTLRNSPSPGISSTSTPTTQNPYAPPPQDSLSTTHQPFSPSPVSPIAESFTAPPGPPPSHTAPTHFAPPHDPFADPHDTAEDHIDHNLDYTEPQPHPHEPVNYASLAPRPGYGDVTQSYLGRQYSAVNGLTMHGGVDTETSTGDVSPVEPPRREVTYRY